MKSIRSKVLIRTLLLVLSVLFICIIISFVTIGGMVSLTEDIFAKMEELSVAQSSDMLIALTSSQAEDVVKSSSETVYVKIDHIFDLLRITSDSIADIYENPKNYKASPFPHASASPADSYCMQWVIPENMKMEGAIEQELYLLGNMEYYFKSTMKNESNILSIYFTSVTGVNIGYDNTPQTKPMYYDGRTANWYNSARDNGVLYLSDPYDDTFKRGKMITLAVPCIDEKGNFYGVCGMDILIEDLEKIIISINTIEDSYAMLVSQNGVVCSSDEISEEAADFVELTDSNGQKLIQTMSETTSGIKKINFGNEDIYCAYHSVGIKDWMIVFIIPKDKIIEPSNNFKVLLSETMSSAQSEEYSMLNKAVFMWIIGIAAITFIAVLNVIRLSRKISSPIIQLSKSVERVGTGDLEYECDIHTGDEIERLSKTFETMTVSLKEYISNYTKVTAEKERISAELNVATQIQADMLPSIFPPFPERTEFDIYAMMTPAKEVGGDFYDFFLIDDDHLALVIADVSGKGVPAALFMVIAKTLIKDQALNGVYSPAAILADVNNKLCEGNEAELFVTVWLAIIEISTGKGKAANAGHEHPAICRKGEQYTLVKYKHSPAVATMEGMRFREHDFELYAGDTLFVYTDGVPEATDSDNKLFGEERMLEALNTEPGAEPKEILTNVKAAVDDFVGEAPQFDDLTMLGFIYYGNGNNDS